MKDKQKLVYWQGRYRKAKSAYQPVLDEMESRERQYDGKLEMSALVEGQKGKIQTKYSRNLTFELIEAQTDNTIPPPKVTPRRQEDEHLARIIEAYLRNQMDRLDAEVMNDMAERICKVQGGVFWQAEWDNRIRTHDTVGDQSVKVLHPKQVIPQDGVYNVQEMDYYFELLPLTKGYILQRYGVEVTQEAEEDPMLRSADGEGGTAEDMVTMIRASYRNESGGIGRFSWVGNTVVEDIEDYQVRRLRRCTKCGALEPDDGVVEMDEPTVDGSYPGEEGEPIPDGERKSYARTREHCPYCGNGKFESSAEEYEELEVPVETRMGKVIPAYEESQETVVDEETGLPVLDGMGMEMRVPVMTRVRIPYYKPDRFPLVLERNVTAYGQLLGDSDVDKIADQQNAVNMLEKNIQEKLLKSGSFLSLPTDCRIEVTGEQMRIIRPQKAADMSMIQVFNLQGDVSQDMNYEAVVYETARQTLGITDSFQGRRDTTATSGKAKEFSAQQSAGRLESKRAMKLAAFAELYREMFQNALAYVDEERTVISQDENGHDKYDYFSRYDFLERDEMGEWYYNDAFIFSCDESGTLARNREAMWQETRNNLASGCYGNPQSTETLVLFWTIMEGLHYPKAAEAKKQMEERLKREVMMAQQQAQQQAQLEAMQMANPMPTTERQ